MRVGSVKGSVRPTACKKTYRNHKGACEFFQHSGARCINAGLPLTYCGCGNPQFRGQRLLCLHRKPPGLAQPRGIEECRDVLNARRN